jgi:GNAT superfamily N-acetyltransferase
MDAAEQDLLAVYEKRLGDWLLSTDRSLLDLTVIHSFLTHSYWARGISVELVQRSVSHSLCFGVYDRGGQVGFSRVISDYATYAYLGDVFVLPSHRGRGLSKWMMECMMAHPALQGLRRWTLLTCDAHGLYARFGFAPLNNSERYMERHNPDVYLAARGKELP